MAELARMRFESARQPAQKGEIVLRSDGTLQVEPSDEFAEELARLEDVAVQKSRTLGVGVGAALIALGALVAAAGWAAGRIAGRLRETIGAPRSVDKVKMFVDPEGGVHLLLRGRGPQQVSLTWAPGETDAGEAAAFINAYRELKEKTRAETGGHRPDMASRQ